jgi:fibronectin-binding autotransporter adhesin
LKVQNFYSFLNHFLKPFTASTVSSFGHYRKREFFSPILTIRKENTNYRTMKKTYILRILLLLLLITSSYSYSTTYYSRANTAWATPSTWSTGSCGGTAALTAPTSSDDVIICATYAVNISAAGNCRSLTIDGTANWTNTSTISVGVGGVTISSTGNITGTTAGILTTTGGLVLNATLTSTTVTIKTITTAGQTISGTGTMAKLDISANTTNNGNITVTTTLASTTASTLTQGGSATFTYNGTTVVPTLDASASGNTVIYGGAAQTIKTGIYHHLTINGSATKTLGGVITVNGDLTVNAGSLATSTFQITGNATGTFTLAASTFFYIGLNSSATNVAFPTNFTTAHCSFSSSSSVIYFANVAQAVSSVPVYGNLTVQTLSGTKTADGTLTVTGNLVTTTTTLSMTTYTLNLTGGHSGTGPLSFSTGNFNIGGSNTSTGAFTCGTGTVNYNGSSAQTVRGMNYNNLTFSGTGDKLLQAAATIGIAGTFARGSMVVTAGATSTVTFNGASPVMTGSATTFTNFTITTGTLTASADISLTGNLVTTSPGTLNMTTYVLNVTGNYTGTGALSFTSGGMRIAGSFTNSGTFTCGTSTIDYNGSGAQTVRGVNYYNLAFSDIGTKTLQASATIGIASTFTRSTMTVTPGASNTVSFTGASPVMTGSATTFTNLSVTGGTLAAPADITVNTTLTTTSPGTLNMSSYTLTVTTSYASTGALSFTSGTFNLNGTFGNTGAFTCGTSTVNYGGAAGQTIRGVNYYNLTFSGAGTKALQAASTIGIAGTFTRGTMTVTAGTTNVVSFNGGAQVMTGIATTFTSMTINNTSITIPADMTINSVLTLTAGTIITGANNIILPATASVSRTSGFVAGNLRKNVATGSNVSRTFEIGTGTSYTPLTVVFATVTTAGTLTVYSVVGDHPAIATSGFNASLTINRYWTLVNASIVYTNYNATATFVDADKDPSYNTANSIIKTYDGSAWATTNGGTQSANAAQALSVTIPVTPNTVHLQIGQIVGSATGNLFSIATGNWITPGTWSTTSGGTSCSCIPTSLDNVTIENSFIVTMNGNAGVAKSLTINTGGKATWTAALTTNIGTGGINIASTGDITGTVAGILTTSGGLVLNSTLTSTTVTLQTIGTPGQTLSGTGTLAKLDISSNTTNNGTLTVTTTLASTTLSVLTQGSTATLTFNGTTALVPTLDASTSGNTVIYGGAAQTVKSATYHHLTINGSGTKTLGGAITVNGNLALNLGSLATSTFQITGNATNTFTMAAATNLYVGLNSSVTNVLFPTNFTTAHMTLNATSNVYYYGNNGQTVSSAPTYGNLLIQTYTGSKLADGTINVSGNLTTTSPAILNMTSYTLNVTGAYASGTGTLSFTTGVFNLTGAFSNTGTFTCGTGTVNYNGASAQTIRGVNYYNLTFSGTGAKTLQAANTIGIANTFVRGAMTVTAGATNTVLFNGGTQVMTGNAITFVNATVNNTSLTIPADMTIGTTLTLTAGTIITSSFNVIIPATGTVSRTSGFVAGNLRKNIAIGSSVGKTYEVGTGIDYAPLTVVFATVTTTGNLTVSTTATDHPAIAGSGFNASYTVNRYWTLVNSALVYTNYTASATFVNADKDPGYNTANSSIKMYNGSAWSLTSAVTPTSNTAQSTGIAIPVSPTTAYLQIGESNPTSTGNLYSIASGNWSTSGTWSQTSGGVTCSCIPTASNDIIIENNYIVTMNGNIGTAKSLTIQTGGRATWTAPLSTAIGTGGINITSTGNITGSGAGILTTAGGLILNTTLTNTALTIKTGTTAGQLISGTGTLANLDVNINTTNNGNITLTDVLTITAGTLTNSGTFTLKSDATKYARIAPISSGCGTCGFAGNFTIQRYLPARTLSTWTDLSSPVSSSTMLDWDNELYMEYPFVDFDYLTNRPTGTNVMAYDEPTANYVELNSSTALTPGKGFEVGLTNSNTGNGFSATTLTTVGTPNFGTVNIPLSFTPGNGPAYPVGYSGENLIGNPYASAITLSAITKTNALSTVDVYDYTINNYKTLTGSDIIGPHQGFWAYAQGTGASFIIDETAKSTSNNTAVHRSAGEENTSYLSLTLSSGDGSNTMAHTLKVLSNENAADGLDNIDHPFRRSLNPKAPSITANAGDRLVTINAFNNNHETYIMPLNVKVGIDGKYKIDFDGVKNMNADFKVILLEDKLTHTFVDLNNSSSYTFTALTIDPKQRFALHFSKSSTYKPVSTGITALNDLSKDVQIVKSVNGNTINFYLSETESADISILDVLGKNIVENLNMQANNQSITITLPENFHGLYFITVQSASDKTVKKFIQP